ncbi:hypothetical protein Y032_0250g165 [Ancylostoma ceylanicum]|uniref:Uncharacterized protein n=1 Tax=Ancylostoma ceylanicum TaxID=53326 RepID=A0A016SD24_9BILA|nr:hypothetical protein Y032_0250g165 [Ancylostoma ceylanicum]
MRCGAVCRPTQLNFATHGSRCRNLWKFFTNSFKVILDGQVQVEKKSPALKWTTNELNLGVTALQALLTS